jgi:hypothetical protein
MRQCPQMPDAQSDGMAHGFPSFALHVPLVQVCCPNVHGLPQAPQFELSVARATQLPVQPLWPAAQQTLPLQLLLRHWGLVWQGLPLPSCGGPESIAMPRSGTLSRGASAGVESDGRSGGASTAMATSVPPPTSTSAA